MGTTQMLFISLSFILFGCLVLISQQRDAQVLILESKKELFDDMKTIGDYANEYYYRPDSSSSDNALETITLDWHYSNIYYDGTIPLQNGKTYKIKVTGLIQGSSYQPYFDPGFYSSNGTSWTELPQTPLEWKQRYIVGTPPDINTYNSNHTYEWTVTGAGSVMRYRTYYSTSHSTNYKFKVELIDPSSGGSGGSTVNSYSGFVVPQYLLNRPYTHINVVIIDDSTIHFSGYTNFESEIIYSRKCTPSGSLQLL